MHDSHNSAEENFNQIKNTILIRLYWRRYAVHDRRLMKYKKKGKQENNNNNNNSFHTTKL